jgi:DNA-binding SARP family transcriptional activator
VEFRVLGPLEVLDHDEPVALAGAKQRALLAILLLNANEVVSSDRLIDELWGAEPPKTAAKSLQVHVSQLRKILEPERATGESGRLLVTRAPGYLLRVESEQLDLARFERLAADGRDALARDDPESAAAKLREALALWRGPPLADLTYADFAQREISRLEELRLAALEDRIQADLECGRPVEVISELERLVAAEPLRERPRAQLMLALYRSGRQAEALEAYREARKALTEELGIEPGRELKELEAAILDHDPSLDLEAVVVQPPHRPAEEEASHDAVAPSESFVGRAPELAEFKTALDGALAGRMSLLLIAGEPGIGKSRLADELTSLARTRGSRVLWGRCWEAGGAPAYWPWVQALRAYIRDTDQEQLRSELEAGAADIVQILPELDELFPDLPDAPSLDPEGARFRLFDSTTVFLRAASKARPIVLVIDDLHAADTPSLLLLRFLARELRGARVVVVAAYRDTEAGPDDPLSETVAELRREPSTRPIRLGALTVPDVARVIELMQDGPPSEELALAIHAETEGNPLFVGELVRLLATEGRLDEAAGEAGKLRIPQGVRDVIAHRLRRLSGDCKRVLAVASVLGREFRHDVLAQLSERREDELFDLLDEAARARVVGELPGGRHGLRFSHALIRDSLYGDLRSNERRRLHRRAAELLEAVHEGAREPNLAELAHHLLEAAPGGDVDKAIDYARRAGDQAAASLAFEEAARLYEMALEAVELKAPRDETTRCDLLLALGDGEARGGDAPAAKETFVRAAEIARKLNAPEQLARAALGYGGRWVWFRAGQDTRLIPLLEDALDGLPDPGPLRARLLARLAGALRDHPAAERRASLSREAVEIAHEIGDPATLAYALEGTYAALSWPRETDAWLELARERTRLADETGDKEKAFSGRLDAFGAFMVRADLDAAQSEFEVMTSLAQELRQPAQIWALTSVRAMRALFVGRIEEADELLERAAQLGPSAQGLEATFSAAYAMNLQTWAVRREQGRLAEIETALEDLVEDYPNFICRSVLASLHCELGRQDEARGWLHRLAADDFAALEVGTEWFFGASVLADVCLEVGDATRAARLYAALLPYADCNVYAHPEAALGSASRPLGLLAATMSRWEDAAGHFERALEMNARMGARPWVAHTQHDHALMLARRARPGDEKRVQELLSGAAATYRELGMQTWARRAETELEGFPGG